MDLTRHSKQKIENNPCREWDLLIIIIIIISIIIIIIIIRYIYQDNQDQRHKRNKVALVLRKRNGKSVVECEKQ